MITFGYKNKFTGPLRALTAIAIGIVMVVSKTNALELAVRIIAAFIMASGIVSLIVGYKNRSNGTMGLLGFNAVVDLILGFALFLYPAFAAGLLIYLIAFVLICLGFFQLISLFSISRAMGLGIWSFAMPFVVLAAGFFLIAKPAFLGESIGVVAGAALIIYGVSELFSSWKMMKAMDDYNNDNDTVDEQ
jgi:uncharacterized membrane protein HdeD (DUF308 family)